MPFNMEEIIKDCAKGSKCEEEEEKKSEENQKKVEKPKIAKQVEKKNEVPKLKVHIGKSLMPESNLYNTKHILELKEKISKKENDISNQNIIKKNYRRSVSDPKNDDDSKPKGNPKKRSLIEPKKNDEENRMLELKGNVEENLVSKENKKEIVILEPNRSKEKELELKENEVNNPESQGNPEENLVPEENKKEIVILEPNRNKERELESKENEANNPESQGNPEENLVPEENKKEIVILEPNKSKEKELESNENETNMPESKGNVEENQAPKENKKEIIILDPKRNEEKELELKKNEGNNPDSQEKEQEIQVAEPKPDQEKYQVPEQKYNEEESLVWPSGSNSKEIQVAEPKPDQEKYQVPEQKFNEEESLIWPSGSNSKDIKNRILKITKPVVEKKAAETLEILRQETEKVLEEKLDTSAPKSLDEKKNEEDGEIQNGTKPVVPTEGKREILFKILVIGELGTGKTSIIKRYVHEFFSQNYRATIGVDFALKVLDWDQNTLIRIQLWDIAGQERFGSMTRVYYKDAVGAFIVFDVTRNDTFDAVAKWKEDLDSKVRLSNGSPIPCILLANKCDQQKQGFGSNKSKMDEYCKEKGFVTWFETSAKENINIEEATKSLITKLLQNDRLISNGERVKDFDKFVLSQKTEKEDKSSCPC